MVALTQNAVALFNKDLAKKTKEHRCLILDSFFNTILFQEGHEDPNQNGVYKYLGAIRRWLKKQTRYHADIMFQGMKLPEYKYRSPFYYDKIIFANNVGMAHWNCMCIFPKAKIIEGYDSSGEASCYYLQSLYRLIKDWAYADWLEEADKPKRWESKKWKIWNGRKEIPRQRDGYNCGVFASHFIYLLGTNQKLTACNTQMADLYRNRYLLGWLAVSHRPELQVYVSQLRKDVMRSKYDQAARETVIIDDQKPSHEDFITTNLNQYCLAKQTTNISGQARWVLENQQLFADWLRYAEEESYHDEAKWEDVLEDSREWFEANDVDFENEDFPKIDAPYNIAYEAIRSGVFLVRYEEKEQTLPATEKSSRVSLEDIPEGEKKPAAKDKKPLAKEKVDATDRKPAAKEKWMQQSSERMLYYRPKETRRRRKWMFRLWLPSIKKLMIGTVCYQGTPVERMKLFWLS